MPFTDFRSILAPAALAALLLAMTPGRGDAAELVIGTRAEPAVDPHYQYLTTNMAYSRHLFDALVEKDAEAKWRPGLAVSWRLVEPTLWEFRLREGVKFHDGSDFTAADVLFSVDRVKTLPNNPNPYTSNLRSIVGVEAVDAHTVRFRTDQPNAVLPGQLGNVFIVSHEAAKGAAPEDFRSGKAAIGTGPYKFVTLTPGDRLVLQRNEQYWGTKPEWERVTFRIVPNDASRVAALRAGDVDLIDTVPPRDVAQLTKGGDFKVFARASDRLIFLLPDIRSPSPYVTDAAGQPLAQNPLQDRRVRLALSKAIDRKAIVERVMEGHAEAASLLVPRGFGGFDPARKVEPYDPAGARKLLAAAGWPNGFGLTVHCTNNRYVNDATVCQVVGQMLARIGLNMKVETLPANVFFPKTGAPDAKLSFMMFGWGNSTTGDAAPFLTGFLHTYDRERGFVANRTGYSDPEFDRLVEEAIVETDAEARETKLRRATAYATDEAAAIPLYTEFVILAARRGIEYTPQVGEVTLAMAARSAR